VTLITRSSLAPALVLAATALAVLTASATAATVSQTTRLEQGSCTADASCLTFRTTRLDAAPGEVNDVLVTYDRPDDPSSTAPETLRFRVRGPAAASAPLTAGPGCSAEADDTILCVFASPLPNGAYEEGSLRVSLGDGDDYLAVVDRDGKVPPGVGSGTTIAAGPGDDIIAASDVVHGGPGDDLLLGGPGVDWFYGDGGDDRLSGGPGDDTLRGGRGRDRLTGGSLSDDLWGGAGADVLDGGPGYDALHGQAGNDHLDGGSSPDKLWGGDGNDSLWGGHDHRADGLSGGAGRDTAWLGPGADRVRSVERTRRYVPPRFGPRSDTV
jgi:Ca2+-binding RTX toxin-like protein